MAESSNQPAAMQPNRNWHTKRDVVVADQAVGLPEVGSFNLYKITPPLKERTDFDTWVDQVEKILRSHRLHNLINTNIPWPVVDDPNGEKWYTLSLQVKTWMTSSIDHTLVQEINARINKENEQFVRDYHPSLSSQAGVSVAESVFGEPVWLVGCPLAPSQSVYAGGRPIHYFPGDHFLDIPGGILTSRSPDRYNEHFDRYINPRRFLPTADLDSLRELFPEAVGVHLLIAGFLIALFEEEQHVHDAYNEAWPLELERVFAVAYRWSARPSGWNFG